MACLQNQHLNRNLQERERVRYSAIPGALQRMQEGTYGICTGCGGPIEPDRLQVLPEVEQCPARTQG